jgi:hypothetical protein
MRRIRPIAAVFSTQAVIVLSFLCVLVLPVILLTPLHSDIDIYQSMALQLYRYTAFLILPVGTRIFLG